MPTWNTALCRATASTSARPSAIVSVGFSQNTSLPASRAISEIGTCQWSGVRDHHGVDVLAGEDLAEVGIFAAGLVAVLGVDGLLGPLALAGEHVAHATTWASGSTRNEFRLWPNPSLPTPMNPEVTRFDGASAPKTRAGTNIGTATMPAAPARRPSASRRLIRDEET